MVDVKDHGDGPASISRSRIRHPVGRARGGTDSRPVGRTAARGGQRMRYGRHEHERQHRQQREAGHGIQLAAQGNHSRKV